MEGDFKSEFQRKAKEFLDEITNNRSSKWNAGGKAGLAMLLGFQQPSDDDDSGVWNHDSLGQFRDDQMEDVVNLLIKKYNQSMLGNPDLKLMIGHLSNELGIMIVGLERSIGQDHEADEHLSSLATELVTLLKTARRLGQSIL